MPDFRYQEMFPHGADTTPYRKLDGAWVGERHVPRRARPDGRRGGAHAARVRGLRDVSHLFRPGHLAQLRDDPRRPRSVGERPLRRAQHAAERLRLGRHGAAVVPGHRHRDRHRQEGPARVDQRRRRARRSRAASTTSTSRRTCATRRWRRSRRSRRRTPAPTCRRRSSSTPTGGDEYHFLFVTKGGGSANKSFLFQETTALLNRERAARVPRAEDAHARHRRLPALSPGDRHRRHVGGDDAEDREARVAAATSTTCRRAATTLGHAIRDPELEDEIWKLTQRTRASARSSAASTSATTCA